jgi:hypothetical protein
MSGFKDTAPVRISGEIDRVINAPAETPRTWAEEWRRINPSPIFLGAILAHDNVLVTNELRLINLFKAMQAGDFEYPESMQPRVDHVEIVDDQRYILPQSEQINFLMQSRFWGLGVSWSGQHSAGNHYGDRYRVDTDRAEKFLREWGDNQEAMDFFTRCSEFLAIE